MAIIDAVKLVLLATLTIHGAVLTSAQGSANWHVSRAKSLRAAANQAELDWKKSADVLRARQVEEETFAVRAAAADGEATAAVTDLNEKRNGFDSAKQQQDMARQSHSQARQLTREEREYYEDLEAQAEEALFEESEAIKDAADAIAREQATKMIFSEQQVIAAEALAEAQRAARAAARMNTTEAKAYQTEMYQVKLEADRILAAVQKQATRAIARVSEREMEAQTRKNDKSETRGASDMQKKVKEQTEKAEYDAFVFFLKKANETVAADKALKASNAVAAQKLKAQRDSKALLVSRVNARVSAERTATAMETRFKNMKKNADDAEEVVRGKGLKLDD